MRFMTNCFLIRSTIGLVLLKIFEKLLGVFFMGHSVSVYQNVETFSSRPIVFVCRTLVSVRAPKLKLCSSPKHFLFLIMYADTHHPCADVIVSAARRSVLTNTIF